MSSGHTKDLVKVLTSALPIVELPLPDNVNESVHAYLERHNKWDEHDAQKLHDELVTIYEKNVKGNTDSYPSFLTILRQLLPNLKGPSRIVQWWDLLILPVLVQLGNKKDLVQESRDILLDVLVYDVDEDDSTDTAETARLISNKLLHEWLKRARLAWEGSDLRSGFMADQIQAILLAFGRRRPRAFLILIDAEFVRKDNRSLCLQLLGEFIRTQPPHLHQLMETPLFKNLLRCLAIDTSTTVVSLAMTALTMFLPHIPNSLPPYLPALFNIYTRILFWERERAKVIGPQLPDDEDDEDDEENEKSLKMHTDETGWEKLTYSFESDDETVPEILHYFTFLYGLYPINFMDYIRKPQRYLRHANFPGADDLDIEPSEIRARSEAFRQMHLLHRNFFEVTIESELTNVDRWMKIEASDVVAECMALFVPAYTNTDRLSHPPKTSLGDVDTQLKTTSASIDDVPEQPLIEKEDVPLLERDDDASDTVVVSRSNSSRKSAGSPMLQPRDHMDSSTLPPMASLGQRPVQDMLSPQKSLRTTLLGSLANDSSVSLDRLSESTPQNPIPRSPSLRPVPDDTENSIAYLQRELMLLKNDLNFERYLKQQHLSHIGQLRRKQIREATVEAETQNLINTNRILKKKAEDARKSALQVKTEAERSREKSKKWEADLTVKLRVLREEQKKWAAEKETLQRDLTIAQTNVNNLKQIVTTSEAKELQSQQKLQSTATELKELDALKEELTELKRALRAKSDVERACEEATQSADATSNDLVLLQLRFDNLQNQLEKSQAAARYEIETLTAQLEQMVGSIPEITGRQAQMMDEALERAHSAIREWERRYVELERKHADLQAQMLELEEGTTAIEDESIARPLNDLDGEGPASPQRQRQRAVSDGSVYASTISTVTNDGGDRGRVRSNIPQRIPADIDEELSEAPIGFHRAPRRVRTFSDASHIRAASDDGTAVSLHPDDSVSNYRANRMRVQRAGSVNLATLARQRARESLESRRPMRVPSLDGAMVGDSLDLLHGRRLEREVSRWSHDSSSIDHAVIFEENPPIMGSQGHGASEGGAGSEVAHKEKTKPAVEPKLFSRGIGGVQNKKLHKKKDSDDKDKKGSGGRTLSLSSLSSLRGIRGFGSGSF